MSPGDRWPVRRVVLALGSNLGDRLENLQGAVDALFDAPGLDFAAVSPVYETAPVLGDGEAGGGPDQPDYLNAVIAVGTALPARTILDRAHGIEEAFGRVRERRWGPRTLDVDVIVCGDEISDDPELTLPHPRAHERAFVLAPWHDIDPGAEIPGRGRVADLLAAVGLDGVRRAGGELQPPA
jgi:2-amino-4-hydroxy-6-hydroxymethyldihydropteridine diphosphokinase